MSHTLLEMVWFIKVLMNRVKLSLGMRVIRAGLYAVSVAISFWVSPPSSNPIPLGLRVHPE